MRVILISHRSAAMYVCICNSVTDRQIREAARNGVCSMDALCDQLRVATCCGTCRDCACAILQEALTEPAVAA